MKTFEISVQTALRLYYPMSGRRLLWCAAAVFVVLLIYPLTLFFFIIGFTRLIYMDMGWVLCALLPPQLLGFFTVATYGFYCMGSKSYYWSVVTPPGSHSFNSKPHVLYRTNKVTGRGR